MSKIVQETGVNVSKTNDALTTTGNNVHEKQDEGFELYPRGLFARYSTVGRRRTATIYGQDARPAQLINGRGDYQHVPKA